MPQALAQRGRWVKDERAALTAGWKAALDAAARKNPPDPAWVSHCIDRAKDARTIVLNEYTLFPEHCSFESPDLYFGSAPRPGSAGSRAPPWRQARASGQTGHGRRRRRRLHVQQSCRRAPCVGHARPAGSLCRHEQCHVGGGPAQHACHVSGWARIEEQRPSLHPPWKTPAFEEICKAAGGYGERVEDPASLPGALERACRSSREGRQALLNVVCGPGGSA